MKDLKDIITEKLRINKDTEFDGVELKYPIISTKNWKRSRVAIIIGVLKNYVKNNKRNLTKDQIKFANDLRLSLEIYYDNHRTNIDGDKQLIKLLNGDPPEFKNFKCIYDAICWTLEKDDTCAKPRYHKLELIMNEFKEYEVAIKKLTW